MSSNTENTPCTAPGRTTLPASFKHAGAGIAAAFATQRNMRIHAAFALAAIILGFVCRITVAEWAVVLICIGVVFGLECINTALEAIVDLASPHYHELAKRAKDAAAGGVLCAAICSLIIGIILFAPPLLSLVGITT